MTDLRTLPGGENEDDDIDFAIDWRRDALEREVKRLRETLRVLLDPAVCTKCEETETERERDEAARQRDGFAANAVNEAQRTLDAENERDEARARLDAQDETLRKLADAATAYEQAVRLAGAYPGHEEYVEAEWIQLQGEKDDADMALADALEAAAAAVPSAAPDTGETG